MKIAFAKALLFVACLLPLGYYVYGVQTDTLGANPIEAVTRGLGTWALNFLLITLTVTPLRRLSGWNWLIRLRRMLGLYAFFYALLHLCTYLWLDQFFDWPAIAKDIVKRPFITIGMLTFALLLPLATTSNAWAIRTLGGKRWQALHRLVYPLTMLAVLHYTWMVKADVRSPAIYALLLALLLGARAVWYFTAQRKHMAQAVPRRPQRRVIPIQVKR